MNVGVLSWTRNGKIFVLILVLSIVLAYWMQQSLLFLLSSFFGGFLALDFFFSFLIRYKLEIRVDDIEDGFCGTSCDVTFVLNGVARIVNSWVQDVWLDVYLSIGQESLMLRADREHNLKIERVARGSLKIKQVVLNSGFPFGFFHTHVAVPLSLKAFVFPKPLKAEDTSPAIESAGANLNLSDEFNMLELYREGDDVRRIHWKKSTLQRAPVVKTNRGEHRNEIATLFIPDPTPRFEKALGILTYWVLHRPMGEWSVLNQDAEIQTFGIHRDFLQTLAMVQPLSFKPDPDFHVAPLFASDIGDLSTESLHD